MRLFLILWLTPISFIALWYGLSAHDLSFGMRVFSRETHDVVFAIYSQALGVEPEALPPLLLRALIIDTVLVLAILGYRKRAVLVPWVRAKWGDLRSEREPAIESPEAVRVLPAE